MTIAWARPAAAAETPIERSRQEALAAQAAADALRLELGTLLRRYEAASLAADEALERWMGLHLRLERARALEHQAVDAFSERVRTAYIQGAGRLAEVVLGSADLIDLAARATFARDVLASSTLDAATIAVRRREAEDALRAAEEAQRSVLAAEDAVSASYAAIAARLEEARTIARANAAALRAMERERARVGVSLGRIASAAALRRRQRGEAMFAGAAPYLGPHADCTAPAGLRATGEVLSGEASWYGNSFRGKPTASGAVYDPGRYTVAHRTMPFGLYLLIRFRDRCVVSFLNDRGPYVEGRILDLSYASAQAIGLTGAKDVTATVLVRSD